MATFSQDKTVTIFSIFFIKYPPEELPEPNFVC